MKSATEVKPFSFEERDKERILRKEEKLREVIQLIPFHQSIRFTAIVFMVAIVALIAPETAVLEAHIPCQSITIF